MNVKERVSVAAGWMRAGIYMGLALAVGMVAIMGYLAWQAKAQTRSNDRRLVRDFGLQDPTPHGLAPGFHDIGGRMVADPSSDARFSDPATIHLAYAEDTDVDVQDVAWFEFAHYLSEVTGKKVVTKTWQNSAEQIADFKDGKIDVLAMHAADTPFLVNNCGYQPVAVLGNGKNIIGNRLNLVVPASSRMTRPAELKGHTLTCSTPSSITGYRAAIVYLMAKEDLRPNIDYYLAYSLGMTRSVRGIVKGEYEAAAISDDKLQTMLKAGEIEPGQFRVIYQSEVFPRTTIGYAYNLKPALVEKIRKAIFDFPNESGPGDPQTGAPLRFTAMDYKRDFAMIRAMDDNFEPRIPVPTQMPKQHRLGK